MRYEIRKDGKTYLASKIKNCGYSDHTLKGMRERGYSLYCDGKCIMKATPLRLRVGR